MVPRASHFQRVGLIVPDAAAWRSSMVQTFEYVSRALRNLVAGLAHADGFAPVGVALPELVWRRALVDRRYGPRGVN